MAENYSRHFCQMISHPYFFPISITVPVAGLATYMIYNKFTIAPTSFTNWMLYSKSSGDDPNPLATRPSGPHKCRFPLGNGSSATLMLPDGRKLGYAEYGAPKGRVVFGMHGAPGSRLEWAFWDEIGKKYNARFIGVDRPRIGWSSPKPGRKVIEMAEDVKALAEHLGLEEYAVMGCSGGGPSALACAHSLPASKLKSAAVVVGVGMPDMDLTGIGFMHALGFKYKLLSRAPWIIRLFWKSEIMAQTQLDDETWLARMRSGMYGGKLHPKDVPWAEDAEFRDDMLRVCVGGMREAFVNGVDAVADDGRTMVEDWGMRIEEIPATLPLQLWYGKFDTFVPPVIAPQIAKRFRGKAEVHVEEETHGSLQWTCQEKIVQGLMKGFEK